MSVVSNLFPPIVMDVAPAFIRTGNCNIYFSLSSFNSITDIKHAQITLINQKNNQSALKSNLYPLGIKFTNISIDSNVLNDYKYYVTIANTDVISNEFEINQFYKVQIRFGDIYAVSPDAAWLNDNIDHFSEWSQVCLIKGIEQPYININALGNDQPLAAALADPIPSLRIISGQLYYINNANIQKETLKSFNITIQQTDGDVVIQSEEIYTDQFHPNEFYYELKQDLQAGENYTLYFNYTTINLYKNISTFVFTMAQQTEDELNATIEITPEENYGRMKINILFKPMFNTNNNLIIKRTSSKTNFTQWEDLKTLIHNQDLQHLWYDTTIESGIWYKYRVQQAINTNPKISSIIQPVICIFEDNFLTNKDKQLKIQFNPTISDFKYNVNESQQVTLGSQFPYIKRNGDNYYRSFSISGLISSLSDEQDWYSANYNDEHGYFYYKNVAEQFTTPSEIYGDVATTLYTNYNKKNNITNYNNYVYERQFRQKVMQYLYKNDIKLFRSLTEGNILIKLTNITFSPVQELGRLLYSFSASATQIDKNTIDNLKKYNLINKFYYTYKTLSITDTFEAERSLINRLYEELPTLQKKNTDIIQLAFSYSGPQDIIVYAKPLNNDIMFRYALENGELILTYSDSDPIAECYFWGIHLNNNEYNNTNLHYDSVTDISNPVAYNVYYILKDDAYRINNYIDYYNNAGLLRTYPEETTSNQNDYSLLTEAEYYKVIYYQNNWYPFSENDDILINSLAATIEYLYRIKKEG